MRWEVEEKRGRGEKNEGEVEQRGICQMERE